MGHYGNDCPLQQTKFKVNNHHKATKGFSFTQYEYSLGHAECFLNPNWVLPDTQSSCDIFNNSDMLENIHQEPGPGLKLHSNGNGLIETNMMGVVKGYGKVWYHPDSLANIMSFANVRKKFKVNISIGPDDTEPMIFVFRTNGKPMSFKEVTSGLYVYDASKDLSENKSKNIKRTSFHYSLVSTVHDNEKKFTNREIRAAKLALDLYNKTRRHSQQVFVQSLENDIIRDSPISAADAKRAFYIYGKDVAKNNQAQIMLKI